MKLKKCYTVLGLSYGQDLAAVKRAYRKLAFSLHPDLNPDLPGASRRFQELNEAYVILTRELSSSPAGAAPGQGESARKARDEANRAYRKAQQGQSGPDGSGPSASSTEQQPQKESILKDILNDAFARRVFEDIYSHIRRDTARPSGPDPETKAQSGPATGTGPGTARKAAARPNPSKAGPPKKARPNPVFTGIKGWLRRQIDDEQVLRLPGEQLVPGARVRLQIRHGLSEESQTIEITLPPEFTPGKPMRLKGMGRRVGSWRGDLYVRLEPVKA